MASTYLQKFPVPEQFPDVLHDLLREILREQPEDIIAFSYRYFKDRHEGVGDYTRTENKNYYGKQIEKQKGEGRSEVISPHKYKGFKADPYKVDRPTEHEQQNQAATHQKQSSQGHQTEDHNSRRPEQFTGHDNRQSQQNHGQNHPSTQDHQSPHRDNQGQQHEQRGGQHYDQRGGQQFEQYQHSNNQQHDQYRQDGYQQSDYQGQEQQQYDQRNQGDNQQGYSPVNQRKPDSRGGRPASRQETTEGRHRESSGHDHGEARSDHSNKTGKAVVNEYYNDLTERAMNMYDDEVSGSRPGTSGEARAHPPSAGVFS